MGGVRKHLDLWRCLRSETFAKVSSRRDKSPAQHHRHQQKYRQRHRHRHRHRQRHPLHNIIVINGSIVNVMTKPLNPYEESTCPCFLSRGVAVA